jgi:hypothetical protein
MINNFMDIIYEAHGKFEKKRKAIELLAEYCPVLRVNNIGPSYNPILNVFLHDENFSVV